MSGQIAGLPACETPPSLRRNGGVRRMITGTGARLAV
jgi:hypothetical protein